MKFNSYGIKFPFINSTSGDFFEKTISSDEELRSNLIHLLLTRKGSRYFLPSFGTRLYEYIFEPSDDRTFSAIESEIRDSVEKFIPQLQIKNIEITDEEKEAINEINDNQKYSVKIRIDYINTSSAFGSSNFIILNI